VRDGQEETNQGELLGGQITHDTPQLPGLGKDLTQRQLVLRTIPPQHLDPRPTGQFERQCA
jgi:hypothetical protein